MVYLSFSEDLANHEIFRAEVGKGGIKLFTTQPSIYGVIVYFLLCHESLNYSTGQ